MTENLEIQHDVQLPEPEVAPAPTAPTRKKVRWYHVAVLGVAVLVCAAAVGFSVSQSSDRDDATRARELLDWEATVPLRAGLARTIEYFREVVASTQSA